MVVLGRTFSILCRCDCRPCKNRSGRRQLKSGHGNSYGRDSPLQLAHRTRNHRERRALVNRKKTWIFLILSGLGTGLSWLCYFRALQVGEVSKVAPIDKLSVVIAMALAITFLGEKLNLRDGIGAGLIVLGAIVLAWK